MVHFSKLKLYGFKSFVDKTELEIGPGLNGIVGPNGCGKSNLVEALRWVMGEKSAKNMRGGGMEDVIFAGTSKRPARNMAEVTVVMNNEDGTAPSPFNSATEIEINRRIEKDKGSQYRVNGKAVRARDVNLLFADTMTGASSPALVSQGRITEIISAKPADRRRILEESAGISGLHSRRHEAELRLRAAEQNLTRLNDSLNEIRSRMASLKRQARQAERYKELSDSIRRLDLALNWGEWSKTHSKIKQDRQNFATHNEAVQTALQATKSLTEKVEFLEKTLPKGRKETMEAQAILQNFRVSLERLEQDIQTKTKGLQDAIDAKTQLETDSDFTSSQFDQIVIDLKAAQTELEAITENGERLPEKIQEAEMAFADIKEKHEQLIADKQATETALAVAKESQNNLANQSDNLNTSLIKLKGNIDLLNEAIEETKNKITDLEHSSELSVKLDDIDKDISAISAQIEKGEAEYNTLHSDFESQKALKDSLTSQQTAIQGELNGLEALLSRSETSDIAPQGDKALLNNLKVKDGYEKAVSSALGNWIMLAGMDDTASIYWSQASATANTPEGTTSLLDYVSAPEPLHAFLTSVGYVEELPSSPTLSAGQMIVAKDGSFMRWDGLIIKAEAVDQTDQTSIILEQKNRIAQLHDNLQSVQSDLDSVTETLEKSESKKDTLEQALHTQRTRKVEKENALRDARYQQQRVTDQIATLNEKLTDQGARLAQNVQEYEQIESELKSIQKQLSEGDDQALIAHQKEIEQLSEQIESVSADMEDSRQTLTEFRQEQASLIQQTNSLNNQISRFEDEKEKLNNRMDDFEKRSEAIEAKIRAYKTAEDDDADAIREELLSKIAGQETVLRDLQTALETQEVEYKSLQGNLREAEASAAAAREQRATAQANVANAEADLQRLTDEIHDRFELSPQSLEEQVFSLFDNEIPSLSDLQNEKDMVVRQRDNIGPVNLRAAIECQETEQHLAEMEVEYDDLTKAIEQLRGGIAKLNREAKDRLAIAFQRVDLHFQRLFTQLFEGGKAYLEMIQSDDPLESGLEIFAQPPGKSLQKLSLLSGGEQTLTATALIFAMFLTNPSPICVLDEIDAPLDDANVDRVCSLMEHIAADTDTRFIVITHHRMTMARMNRLYGVTMGERGVSQLVSVDLALQEELELAESA